MVCVRGGGGWQKDISNTSNGRFYGLQKIMSSSRLGVGVCGVEWMSEIASIQSHHIQLSVGRRWISNATTQKFSGPGLSLLCIG